jgi:uncharacterized SAM-binding protein YcdF (DUF218 family)
MSFARAARRRRERGGVFVTLLVVVILVALAAVIYLLRVPLLQSLGGLLIVDESPQPADTIIVLGDDTYLAERVARAGELYHERWAPRVIASGRYLRPYATIPELMEKDLLSRGVPAEAIVRYPQHSGNTREEALALRELLTERRWRRVLVVTSNYHTRRTRYIFRRVLLPGITVRVVAARDAEFVPESWWCQRTGWKRMFFETVGLCVAFWELRGDVSRAQPARAPTPAPAP